MRTSRGLQITSIVVLSPVLLILISLISILFLSIYSHIQSILSTQTLQRDSADMIISQQQRSFNHTKSKRFRFFSKSRQSPMTWCIIIICYLVYILIKKRRDEKKQKETETRQTEPIPIKTKKHSKRRKVLKKTTQKSVKKRERTNSFSLPFIEPKPVNIHQPQPQPQQQQQQPLIDDKEEWTSVKKKIVNTHSLPSPTSCTTPEFDNNLIDLLPSPEITPIHSEDEQQEQQTVENHNNWYSPFVTGLDLDIIPKLPQDPLLSIFTINHFKTTIPSIHSPPSRIKLLESHPFIPSSSSSHTHPPPTYGFIGDKRKKV